MKSGEKVVSEEIFILYKILVITPVGHIKGVPEILDAAGSVTYMEDPRTLDVISVIADYHAVFTNPNKSKVYIGSEVLKSAKNLKVVCTASTGTNHIDMQLADRLGITVLALTEERHIINRISSTAELAFGLTLTSLRHIVRSHQSVRNGEWDYEQFIGRQMNCLTIGVIGYGRLGGMYCNYCKAFGSRILVYDPYKRVSDPEVEQVDNIDKLLRDSDVISVHVHVSEETIEMLNESCFQKMKKDVVLVNTARGDVVDESALVNFLLENQDARVATDVLADEIRNRKSSPLLNFATQSDQVIITPHIGGMCREAQEIAFCHAAARLSDFISRAS